MNSGMGRPQINMGPDGRPIARRVLVLKPGYTLSQTGLALHLQVTRTWVRRRGDRVVRHGEVWERMRRSSGRCAGYLLKRAVESA